MVVITVIFMTGFDRMAGHPGLPGTVSVYTCLAIIINNTLKIMLVRTINYMVTLVINHSLGGRFLPYPVHLSVVPLSCCSS